MIYHVPFCTTSNQLDEAIEKLREFIKQLSTAIEYEEKQEFLLNVSILNFNEVSRY